MSGYSNWCSLARYSKGYGYTMCLKISKALNGEEKDFIIDFDKDLNITEVRIKNCTEDFDYVYGKLKEEMK